MDNISIAIENGNTIYYPVVEDGVTWETERKGSPGKFTFKIAKDDILKFEEGNHIVFNYGDNKVFNGFIFTGKHDQDKIISVTAYDQLRYFKNKDSYMYTNKKASDVVNMISEDFRLNVGEIDDTEFIIEKRDEDNQTLFDIVQNALDLSMTSTNKIFCLYDDYGKLMLKDIENLKVNIIIDEETIEGYSYTSTIDSNVYNRIKLAYDNKDTGTRDIYIAKSSENENNWGILQYFDKINEVTNGQLKADTLLKMYNKKCRNLTIKNALGDVRVRAGTSVLVRMKLYDIELCNYMLVEKAKHTFNHGQHLMDLTLRGHGISV